jgi:hypothetical protein
MRRDLYANLLSLSLSLGVLVFLYSCLSFILHCKYPRLYGNAVYHTTLRKGVLRGACHVRYTR